MLQAKKEGVMKHLVLLLSICLWFSEAKAQNARQIAQKVFHSIVLLVMEDANGQPLSQGCGFFVRPDIVATNYHVVEGSKSGFAKLIGRKKTYSIASVVAADPNHDLALLKINGINAPPLSFPNNASVGVGDRVYDVGNPLGLEGTFTEGIVSGVRHSKGGDTFIQISAPISPGSSGGPVLNSKGQVIGVATGFFKGGQNLNFAVPSSYIKAALTVGATPRSLSTLRRRKKSLSELGGKSVEAIKVTHFQQTLLS